jgi:hypothetical protein
MQPKTFSRGYCMQKSKIPPPSKGGRVSVYSKHYKNLRVGEFITLKSRSQQYACYNYGKRQGKDVAIRTVGGEFRVYLKSCKRGAK